MAAQEIQPLRLKKLDADGQNWHKTHHFSSPTKRIEDGNDVHFFLQSRAYANIMTFLSQLNYAMFPWREADGSVHQWPIGSLREPLDPTVKALRTLVGRLEEVIGEVPPDMGPRRFGNVAFRRWWEVVEGDCERLLREFLPAEILGEGSSEASSPLPEIRAYFLGSFGSAQRLDFGTGHELSFLAFLGCIWKLGAFNTNGKPGEIERQIVLGVMEPYFNLIRKLVLTYTLEPAGSHGVWGLDDHFFLPYIFGSAQLAPALSNFTDIPIEGSIQGAPKVGDVTKKTVVDQERSKNMYFAAVGFINDVKKGPFWEHSPILFDISGVTAGWAKVNKGMIKMYHAEVLSKFPVVQHFPFGSLFPWEEDPEAKRIVATVHTASQPSSTPKPSAPLRDPMAAPGPPMVGTAAPWATRPPGGQVPPQTTRHPGAPRLDGATQTASGQFSVTAAPWAKLPDRGNRSMPPSGPTQRQPPG